jgi:hypothetical protein
LLPKLLRIHVGWGWYDRPTSGQRAKWTQPHPTSQIKKKDTCLISPQPLVADGGDGLQIWRHFSNAKKNMLTGFELAFENEGCVLDGHLTTTHLKSYSSAAIL